MTIKRRYKYALLMMALLMISIIGNAIGLPYWQDNRQRNRQRATARVQQSGTANAANRGAAGKGKGMGKPGITAQPILADEDTIPDSLLHTRWPVQRTQPITVGDLYQSPLDLQRPDNMKYEVAQQMGINLTKGYNGNLSSREAGYIGGNMVKKMIEAQEKQMSGK